MANPAIARDALLKAKSPRVSLKRLQAKVDRTESKAVRERSEGQCEVVGMYARCTREADHVHHMIGGRGKRGIGISALRQHKQHVCALCHRLITGDVGGKKLIRIGGEIPMWTDRYRRVK